MDIQNKRTVVLVGHAQSGKTTLSESLLYFCKATTRKGSVTDGTTVSDYSFDEIERKNSINASFMFFDFEGIRVQLVDTPGYTDFFAEVISSIRAVDNAIVVVDATTGVEVGTEKAWQLLEEAGLPRLIFINKIDKEGADFERVYREIRERLSKKAVFLDTQNNSELMELAAESDDSLLEKYLSEGTLSAEEIERGLSQAVIKAKIFPVIKGSALLDQGIEELLRLIKRYLASPLERARIEVTEAINPENKKELVFDPEGLFTGFVFKSIFDPYVGQLSLVRVFSGKLSSNSEFYNVSRKIKERFGQLYILQGKEQRPVDTAFCGDIVAIPKLKETQTQDSLGTEKESLIFPPLIFPETMASFSVKPRSRQDEEKISQALSKLTLEDPTFKALRDPQTKELVIHGLGDLHLEIMTQRLRKRFGVEVDLGRPRVAYKETVTKTVKVQGKYKRQSGGRGQYGDVWIEVSPLERGKGFVFVDKIFGGAIPKNFIPAVEKGIRQAMEEGVLAGYPIVDIQVVLYDGSYHEVDSSDIAFQIAGAMALRKAAQEGNSVLLEPIMDVEVVIPEDYLGQISGDLNSRRGRIMGMEPKGKLQVVKAQVPQAEMFTYANDLRSITGGRGSYTMRFSHYEEVPAKIASSIISQYQAQKKQEEQT
ncbi:MAG: elongation factor G [Candidatus Omnitrophica bacterium]|nr:elongation factor G [Candidatus Omnitrophota bacterium]